MPVRRMTRLDDVEEEKSVPFSTNDTMKPISVPLKQVFMVLILVGFIYQVTVIYKESTVKNKTETDK